MTTYALQTGCANVVNADVASRVIDRAIARLSEKG